jgi:hypothetical protein
LRSAITTNSQIDRFNHLVNDWNSRCSSYRHQRADMRVVEQELEVQRARLWREGKALAEVKPRSPAASVDRWWEDAPRVEAEPPRSDAPASPAANVPPRLLNPSASAADARAVQERLAALGLYRSTIDGLWEPNSGLALTDFKRRAGLSADAVWDWATQEQLFQGRR